MRKVGEDNLTRIVEERVVRLLRQKDGKDVDAVLDTSFIGAWSIRHPLDNQIGLSDCDARVGRAGRTFGLGYKLRLSINSQTMLPLTCVIASANQNEKKHSNLSLKALSRQKTKSLECSESIWKARILRSLVLSFRISSEAVEVLLI